MNPPTVPHPRDIDKGMHGDDVIAVKHALSRAGYLPWGNFTPLWDDAIMAAIQPFQNAHQVPPGPGTYGPKTHAALVSAHRKGSTTEWAYDAHAVALMTKFAATLAAAPKVAGTRGAVLAEAARLYAHRGRNRLRPDRGRSSCTNRHTYPPSLDCSSFVTLCYFVAGAPDPSGLSYTGYGNTTNLLAHGASCTPQELVAGDLVFYGSTLPKDASEWSPVGSPTHVVLYDHDGLTYSQGGPNEMHRERFDYRPIVGCRHHEL